MLHRFLDNSKRISVIMLTMISLPLSLRADLVRLKQGGELRGKIVTNANEVGYRVCVRTVTGAIITVHKKDVEFETRRPLYYETYELKSRLVPETVEAQWEMAEWCREQRLKRQQEIHLEKMLAIDPDHEVAHRLLGHVERDGKWASLEEHMLDQGYVKHRGRYITPEEKMLLEHSQEERERQSEWMAKASLWASWLTGRLDKQREIALENFRGIDDPLAIPGLQRHLGEQENRDLRNLYIETLSQINDSSAISALVRMGVFDGDRGLRMRAIEKIPENQTNFAVAEFVQHLRDSQNVVVRRAATGLRTLGSSKAVPQLIDALVTNHSYRIKVPNPTTGVSIGPGGAVSSGGGSILPPDIQAALLTGVMSPDNIILPPGAQSFHWETVNIAQQNPEVLEALKSLTSVDFGFDERTWKLWLLSQNT